MARAGSWLGDSGRDSEFARRAPSSDPSGRAPRAAGTSAGASMHRSVFSRRFTYAGPHVVGVRSCLGEVESAGRAGFGRRESRLDQVLLETGLRWGGAAQPRSIVRAAQADAGKGRGEMTCGAMQRGGLRERGRAVERARTARP